MTLANGTRRRLLKGAMALPAAALGGCVATPFGPYYRPSAEHPGATYKGAWCNGVAGPKSVIELPLADGVVLSARAERDYGERDRPDLPLRIALTLPPTQPARFLGASLKVVDADGGKPLGSAPEVAVFRYATLGADAWVDPVRVRPAGAAGSALKDAERHGVAGVRVSFEPGFTPDRLEVGEFVVAHDGGSTKMPVVTMSRPASKSDVRDYRSAALHAALQQKADACRRETPKLACDNIVEYSSVSFVIDEAAARRTGRLYVSGDGPGARIQGALDFALRAPGRWRAPSNTLTVRDMAGNTRTGSFSQITLALNDRIALDTPLFAGPVDGTGYARLSIEARLPPAPSGFEVVLPDLELGAKRIAIPPLRFDRRTFDGGIEPFNC